MHPIPRGATLALLANPLLAQSTWVAGPTQNLAAGALRVSLEDGVAVTSFFGDAQVYERSWTSWDVVATLPAQGSVFGHEHALQGGRIAMSAEVTFQCAAYLYEQVGGVWTQTDLVVLPGSNGGYGTPSLALYGERLVMGAWKNGKAGVFLHGPGGWTLEQTLQGANYFGRQVDIDGDTVAVMTSAGADVFRLGSNGWTLEQHLDAPTGFGIFPGQIDLSGDRLVIGSAQALAGPRGAAATYERTGTTWQLVQVLTGSAGGVDDDYGASVCLRGDRLLVTAPTHWVTHQPTGAAYLYAWDGTQWVEVQVIEHGPDGLTENFGNFAAMDDQDLAVLSLGSSELAMFRAGTVLGSSYCTGGTNSHGTEAQLVAFGSPIAAENDFQLWMSSAVPHQFALPLFGPDVAQTPLGDGTLCLGPPTRLRVLPISAGGNATSRIDMFAPPVEGAITSQVPITMHFQTWYRDGSSSNLSDAVTVAFQ